MGWDITPKKEEKKKETVVLKPEHFFKPQQEIEQVKGLKIGIWGEPETGKSYFSMTCPEPIYIIDTEFAAVKLAKQHFPNKKIYIYECSVIDEASPLMEPDPIQSLENVEKAIISLKDVNVGTIVVDTVSDYWQWMGAYVEKEAKRFYKSSGQMMRTEWATGNERYRYFINRLLIKDCTVVLTSQTRPIYEGGQDTGRIKPAWQRQTRHWVDIEIWARKNTSVNPPKYEAVITKCRFQRAENKVIEDLTYPKLVEFLRSIGVKVV